MSGFIKTWNTTQGPKALGPYSTGKIYNGTLYLSGQIGIDPKTGELVSEDVKIQTIRALENLRLILEELSIGFEYVIKSTVFLTTMNDFTTMNEEYAKYFKSDPPARSCIAVAQLPKGAKVEIEVVVAFPYPKI